MSAVADVVVSLSDVSKRFETGTQALAGVNLDLKRGEFVSLLGPSGCGKSTLLRLIAGLSPPTSGSIRWQEQEHELGVVFQEPTLMPWASALANVMLPLKIKHVPRGEAEVRARDMLALVGLTGFEQAYPRELSGGMKMRVAIARALVTRPSVLLMDEPFAALDEITRHKLNDDLIDLWLRQKFTALFVTHSVFESVYLSQRILTMAARPGRIVAEQVVGSPFPRGAHFRTEADYAAACRQASDALKEAMAS